MSSAEHRPWLTPSCLLPGQILVSMLAHLDLGKGEQCLREPLYFIVPIMVSMEASVPGSKCA